MTTQDTHQKIAILDAGSQYGKVIDRRVRELQVESELLPLHTPAADLAEYQAIIISGGPSSVDDANAPKYDPGIFKLGKPILGICYGMYLVNVENGGTMTRKGRREDGPTIISLDPSVSLFKGLAEQEQVLMSHGDTLGEVAPGFQVTAHSGELIAGIANPELKQYGVQFHPEVDLTLHGKVVLRNFLFEVVGCRGDFKLDDRLNDLVAELRDQIGQQQVLVLVSGGVDSTVCARLLAEAVPPEQITAVHIDTGFMRQNESQLVISSLEKVGIKVVFENAVAEFSQATTLIKGQVTKPLSETVSPEEKRNIIGDTFIKVTQRVMAQLKLDPEKTLLVQGTLRPDLIESASSLVSQVADRIKTHHNDTDLVRQLREQGRVIEPLKEYHKDEVRHLGEMLGLPEELVWRQPFPGPGLAIRVICAETPYQTAEFTEINQRLAAEFSDSEIRATLLPIQTVGVQGDGRTYSYAVALSGQENWPRLFELAREIPRLVHQVNRVVFVFGQPVTKPLTTITPTHLAPEVLAQLQAADAIVNAALLKAGLIKTLSQVPVISFPANFGQVGAHSIAIRTFITNDFMTGVPAVPGQDIPTELLHEIVEQITTQVPGIARVAYDLTSKPPGTTEWE